MTKLYRVYSYNLMRYLETLGFVVIQTKQRREDASKTIWIYNETPQLIEAIDYYVKTKESLN